MEEKIFDLIEKLYIDMQDMKSNMATKQDLEGMATKHDIVRLENKMDTNFKALYDGYQQSIEGITDLRGKVDSILEKLKDHDINIKLLKTAR